MNKITFKRHVFSAVIALGVAVLPGNISAAEADEECSQEILLSYFPNVFVSDTLSRFNVPKDQWDVIKKELAARDKDIIKQVETKASKLTPNPLKDPQQRQAAVKLFRDTLLENFSAVLKAHGVTDDKQIQSMLDDIQQQKAKRFARCMEKQRGNQPMKSSSAPAMMKNLNDDSDDDSDDDMDDSDDNMNDSDNDDSDTDSNNVIDSDTMPATK